MATATKKKTARKTVSTTVEVAIPSIEIKVIRVKIIGDSRLVVHRWSEKARKQIEDKQQGKAAQKKAPKNPKQEYADSMYKLRRGGYGFPAGGFRKCFANAFRTLDGIKKVEINASLHIVHDDIAQDGTECVKLTGKPNMRTDMVRIAGQTADVRYRGEFPTWSCTITLRYNARCLTPEQIVNIINNAGFGVGAGEGRPERGGSWGTFHVDGAPK